MEENQNPKWYSKIGNFLKNAKGEKEDKHPTEKTEENQKNLKVMVPLALVLILIVWVKTKDDKPQPLPPQIKLYEEEDLVKSRYMGEAVEEVKSNSAVTQQTKNDMDSIKKQFQDLQKEIEYLKKNGAGAAKTDDRLTPMGKTLLYNKYPTPPGQPPLMETGPGQSAAPAPAPAKKLIPITQALQISQVEAINSDLPTADSESKEEKDTGTYLPTSSFFKVVMLDGINAPTLSNAKNPHPVKFRITDDAIIPNRKNFDVKECFVMGEAWGVLASERIMIRTNTISCVSKDNKIIDQALDGYVTGGDGVPGIKADRIVFKGKEFIKGTFIASFFESMATNLSTANQVTYVGSTGTSTQNTADQGQLLEASTYGGLAGASGGLKDLYLQYLKAFEPIMESLGKKRCEITVTKGLYLKEINIAAEQKQGAKS